MFVALCLVQFSIDLPIYMYSLYGLLIAQTVVLGHNVPGE